MQKKPQQTVKKRLVYYISGFDPLPPNRYREGYASEGKKQAEISGYSIDVARKSTIGRTPRFEINADFDGEKTVTDYRFIIWNDLVAEKMSMPIWKSWLGMFSVARVIAGSKALRNLIKLHFPPNIAGLYPFVMIPFQIGSSLLLGWLAGWLLEMALPESLNGIRFLVMAVLSIFLIRFWHKNDGTFLAYYMLHDLIFICQKDGATPDKLVARLKDYEDEIAAATKEGYDEILIVGHSSGAHLGVILLADLIKDGRISPKDKVALLTIGQAIPLVSYLPGARDLRDALYFLSDQEVIKWVDFTAQGDGASFALHDPVACSVTPPEDQKYPRVLSAAFRQRIAPERYKTLKWRFFRLHFQYLCHFEHPGIYDYFAITAGPIRLWQRFGRLKNSPSLKRTNLNPFKDDFDHGQS